MIGVQLITKLPVEFSDLHDHRFTHNFHCVCPLYHGVLEYTDR